MLNHKMEYSITKRGYLARKLRTYKAKIDELNSKPRPNDDVQHSLLFNQLAIYQSIHFFLKSKSNLFSDIDIIKLYKDETGHLSLSICYNLNEYVEDENERWNNRADYLTYLEASQVQPNKKVEEVVGNKDLNRYISEYL